MLMKKKPYVIFTKRLAGMLCDLGFKMIDSCRNSKNPQFYIYLFEDTPELREVVEKYRGKGGGRNG